MNDNSAVNAKAKTNRMIVIGVAAIIVIVILVSLFIKGGKGLDDSLYGTWDLYGFSSGPYTSQVEAYKPIVISKEGIRATNAHSYSYEVPSKDIQAKKEGELTYYYYVTKVAYGSENPIEEECRIRFFKVRVDEIDSDVAKQIDVDNPDFYIEQSKYWSEKYGPDTEILFFELYADGWWQPFNNYMREGVRN